MRAEKRDDITTRTITITIDDGPELDASKPWIRYPITIKATGAVVTITDGIKQMRVLGNRIKKDGTLSTVGDSVTYGLGTEWGIRGIEHAPEILQKIFVECDHGMRAWSES